MEKVVVILSGGLDSSTLLYYVKRKLNKSVSALTFDYGQRHRKEIECAVHLCEITATSHRIITLPHIFDGSALTSDIKVPEDHYTHENQKLTVVPNRNMIMLSLAAGWAESIKATEIFYAAHSNDHAIYWDCRPDFLTQMNSVLELNDIAPIIIRAPFIHNTKADIVKIGNDLKVPFKLTWSCYNGRDKACGKCGTCQERIEAFQKNKLKDPIEYEGGTK